VVVVGVGLTAGSAELDVVVVGEEVTAGSPELEVVVVEVVVVGGGVPTVIVGLVAARSEPLLR